MNFNKKITVLAAVMGALTVIIGAFGAHGLKEIVSEKTITSFETCFKRSNCFFRNYFFQTVSTECSYYNC